MELEPDDVCPPRIDMTAREGEEDEAIIDDEDDPDEARRRLPTLPPPVPTPLVPTSLIDH